MRNNCKQLKKERQMSFWKSPFLSLVTLPNSGKGKTGNAFYQMQIRIKYNDHIITRTGVYKVL